VCSSDLIFVLENNMYSMGTHIGRGTSMAEQLHEKAEGYGMRYAEVDGQDVLAVYKTFSEQVAMTRDAKNPQWERGHIPEYHKDGNDPGPAFINVVTYRYQGHSMSDPQKYRSKDEVGEFEDKDCINRMVRHMIEHDLATQEQIDEQDGKAKDAAKQAIKFAEDSPEMPEDEMFTDIYLNHPDKEKFPVGKPAEGFTS